MLYLPFIWALRASKHYSFLFIDECQDLSKSQLAVVLKHCRQGGRILAVGDPYQSIYGFAGADIESFHSIKKMIKAKELPLTTCFRCPPNVVALATSIRSDISASKNEDGSIEEISFKQVVKIAKKGDLIISRYREPILFLVFEFINKNIQVQIHDDEVNEIIDELKKLFKQEERTLIIAEVDGGFESIKEIVLKRWLFIIEKEAERLPDSGERHLYIETKTKYLANKLEFMHKKYLQWKTSCRTINEMLRKIKDFITATENSIRLSTIHRAKGLEAKRVFILNFDDLPHFKPSQKPWEKIQEKNLKYVAITRALNDLFLVKSEKKDAIKKEASLFDEFISEI
jgi:superfamily I DNA/RNA helicase